jgi:ABC-type lipoprotein export system ATPase subunit
MTLQIEQLRKSYGDLTVFEQVDLTVARGEFVAIVGESGVGKSTLLNCMAGLDTWSAGRVLFDGVDIGTLSDTARALLRRQHVGFVFQAFHVLPHLDVAQNVGLPLLLLGRGCRPCWRRSACRAWASGCRSSSAAGSCSAWPSPGRWCMALPCCWPTSPPATSTRRPPRW